MTGGSEGRSLEETPTWAVAVVFFILVGISIVIEQVIHLIGKWFKKKGKKALYEALEKIKSELMLLGFVSLLLTIFKEPISDICISKSIADTWHPCKHIREDNSTGASHNERRALLEFTSAAERSFRRVLSGEGIDKCTKKDKVAFISSEGLHQLHIFIFVLALSHVIYCVFTVALARAKMTSWKAWEKETMTAEYQSSLDPDRFRFARDTSFGRRHSRFWEKNPVLIWIVCFFWQFIRSVPKVDYLALRHGFIMAHLAPHSHRQFNFQKYIKRSLQADFKVVVEISPQMWLFGVLFLLSNTYGSYSYIWLPFLPLILILLVGTKLQVIIAKMGLRILERGEVVSGVPVVQPGDHLFWFGSPRLLLLLIKFVLFQNAFQLAFMVWTLWQFGTDSCYHDRTSDIVIKITMGVLIQLLCSYVTLPLYALVTQMGSTIKPTIFNDGVVTALKEGHQSGSNTPFSSSPATPSRNSSPTHSLRRNKTDTNDAKPNSPRRSIEAGQRHTNSTTPSNNHHQQAGDESRSNHHNVEMSYYTDEIQEAGPSMVVPSSHISVNMKHVSIKE